MSIGDVCGAASIICHFDIIDADELMGVLATIRDNVLRSDIMGHTINPGAKRAA
jgi:hypothetical protein